MRFFITGGAGFIGSHLVQALLKDASVEVICIDNYDPFYSRALKTLNIQACDGHRRFRFYDIDLNEVGSDTLLDLFPDPVDVLIHLAAKPGIQPSLREPVSVYQTNILGTQTLLDFAVRKAIGKVVFASSSSVYGNNSCLPLQEHYRSNPVSPYALSKVAGEEAGRIYSEIYGLHFIALRLFTVYGPRQRPDLAIHRFVKAILTRTPIACFGDGRSRRDYTYVDDVVSALVAAAHRQAAGFEVFNIGSSRPVSLLALIRTIEEVTGVRATLQWDKERPGDVLHTYADIRKAQQHLAYFPATPLREGLTQFYEWFKKNEAILY